ncbi:MAG TPA: hypothetical protein VFQ25_08100 [Ktedonobacterales bacterium]|nr:hypothetical protein [Ktedonobacterales bacterium]
MSEREPQANDELGLAPPARITRETLLGCLGIACVLLLLPLLWLAAGAASSWLARALPLGAFALVVLGVVLTLRVPGALTPRSRDPRRPLTREGRAPLIERPATPLTRASFALAAGLGALAGAGYLLESGAQGTHTPWGLLVSLIAGMGLMAQGVFVGAGRLTPPALRWQRLAISGAAPWQGATLAAIGFVAVGGSLLLAMLEGYTWGAAGLAALLLILVVSAPFARRTPGRGSWIGQRQEDQGARE